MKSSRRSVRQSDASETNRCANCSGARRLSTIEAQHFIADTTGHADHGKSALVKALTGTDPDRLPEEKARGITIDLGFVYLELPASVPGASSYLLGIADVPGHEDFVMNMVAGVGSIDLMLFVVATGNGWMPKTEERPQILAQ